MWWRARSFWGAALAVAYVAFAALRATHGSLAAALALVLSPLALVVVWRTTERPSALLAAGLPPRALVGGEDLVDDGARSGARATCVGALVLLAARAGTPTLAFTALANLGAGVASMGSLVAIARLRSLGGMLAPPPSARRLEAAAFASLVWTVAIALPAARVAFPERFGDLDPAFVDAATSFASIGACLLAVVTSLRVRASRRFELGVGDRATAATLLALAATAVGVMAAFAGVAAPEHVLPEASVAASIALATSAAASDATLLRRALRVALTLVTIVTPVALGAVAVARLDPPRAASAAFVGAGLAAIAGLVAPRIARRFAPEARRWREALDAASRAAMNPDPDAAIERALVALRSVTAGDDVWGSQGGGDARAHAPALYRLEPAERLEVDRAGYAHTERAHLPETLVALADGEPERVLFAEVARAVEVRRPDVRDALRWMDEHEYGAAAVVREGASAIGLLALPRGARTSPFGLDEVRALRDLADRLGAIIGVSSQLARSRAREIEGQQRIDALEEQSRGLTMRADRTAGRFGAIAERLARPARTTSYSPAARAAVEQLERLAENGAPIALLAAPGIDAIAWGALAHVASKRAGGAFVVVDASLASDHDLARWRDPATSPIAAAADGTLMVLDAHALPLDVQSYLGAATTGDAGLVVAVPASIDALVATGKLSERLADRLGARAVALPTLGARGEDLRSVAVEHLTRIGARLGRDLGLDPRALAVLLDHTWPGNDAELHAVLLRAAIQASGPAIVASDLEAIGFRPSEPGREVSKSVPPRRSSIPPERRRRSR